MSSILTVSQLNRYMSFKIKEDDKLRGILIKGEISGFTNHQKTGHFYFVLKDRESAVKAVMFRNFASRLSFMPENGMSVILMGSVQVYERDGVYQINVTDIQPDGIGAMYLAVEQLKERLAAEGLFDERFKKPLPRFPARIGIVTAKGGAALQDILNILGRRYPVCEAIIFPCLVQGEYAAASVSEALRLADTSGCDVIICGRGGGSQEDLMPFNSEIIARTVYAMNTPIISAVGHETDTTVIDLVSDLRAPTPSAAAELAVPDISVLRDTAAAMERALTDSFNAYLSNKRDQLFRKEAALNNYYPAAALSAVREKLNARDSALNKAVKQYFEKKDMEIAGRAARLDGLSPLKIMSRGYSLVYSKDKLVLSADMLQNGDIITVRFSDSEVNAEVRKLSPKGG